MLNVKGPSPAKHSNNYWQKDLRFSKASNLSGSCRSLYKQMFGSLILGSTVHFPKCSQLKSSEMLEEMLTAFCMFFFKVSWFRKL